MPFLFVIGKTSGLTKVRQTDPEEYLYQETLMGQYISLCLLLLANSGMKQESTASSGSDGPIPSGAAPAL